jgi:hypothetical protein
VSSSVGGALSSFFGPEQSRLAAILTQALVEWGTVVIGRHCFVRQATTLLKGRELNHQPSVCCRPDKAADLNRKRLSY